MDYLIVGKVINTHGIRGEVRVDPLTNNWERFLELEKIYIGQDKEPLTIEGARKHKKAVLVKFNEYDNINDVLQYKNSYLYIDIDDRVELPENNFFIYELIGLRAYTMDDNYIGELVDVIQGSSNDVYVIKTPDNKEAMIPAVKEFIKLIDIEEKIIKIEPIEGMI